MLDYSSCCLVRVIFKSVSKSHVKREKYITFNPKDKSSRKFVSLLTGHMPSNSAPLQL